MSGIMMDAIIKGLTCISLLKADITNLAQELQEVEDIDFFECEKVEQQMRDALMTPRPNPPTGGR